MDSSGFQTRSKHDISPLSETFGLALEPIHLTIQWPRGSFPGVKRPGREVHHSSPSSVKVKNEWSYTPSPPIFHHGVDRDSFIFIWRVPKIAKSDYQLRHVCPSAWGNWAPTGRIFMKFDIYIYFFFQICRENSSFIKIRQ